MQPRPSYTTYYYKVSFLLFDKRIPIVGIECFGQGLHSDYVSETFVISRLIVPYISPMVVGFIYGTCIVGFSSSSILAPHTIIFSIAFVQHLWRELSAEVQSFDGLEFQVDITESAESFFSRHSPSSVLS